MTVDTGKGNSIIESMMDLMNVFINERKMKKSMAPVEDKVIYHHHHNKLPCMGKPY